MQSTVIINVIHAVQLKKCKFYYRNCSLLLDFSPPTFKYVATPMGGVVIIALVCVVILCIRQSHKKRSLTFDDKMIIEMNSVTYDVIIIVKRLMARDHCTLLNNNSVQ